MTRNEIRIAVNEIFQSHCEVNATCDPFEFDVFLWSASIQMTQLMRLYAKMDILKVYHDCGQLAIKVKSVPYMPPVCERIRNV